MLLAFQNYWTCDVAKLRSAGLFGFAQRGLPRASVPTWFVGESTRQPGAAVSTWAVVILTSVLCAWNRVLAVCRSGCCMQVSRTMVYAPHPTRLPISSCQLPFFSRHHVGWVWSRLRARDFSHIWRQARRISRFGSLQNHS